MVFPLVQKSTSLWPLQQISLKQLCIYLATIDPDLPRFQSLWSLCGQAFNASLALTQERGNALLGCRVSREESSQPAHCRRKDIHV